MGDWDFFVTDHSEVVEQALVSANTASQTTRTMWLSFLGLMAYLIVTLAGVTHKDLLLNGAVKLPIVIVEMPLIRFFTFAPCLLVLFHFGLLMQHVTLAQKLKSFDEGVRLLGQPKSWDERTRLRLHGYSITQYVAGPKTSWIIVSGQWFMGWLTLNVIPLAVLLYFQIQFLPYHSEDLTKLHRITILADLVVLFPLGMFAEHPAHSFKEVLLHNIRQRKGFITLSISAALFVLFVSFTVATFPGEPIDEFIVDNEVWLVERSGQLMFRPTALFFEVIEVKDKDKNKDGDKDKSRSWFDRNLVVTDEDIVIDSKLEKDGPSLRLYQSALNETHLGDSQARESLNQ